MNFRLLKDSDFDQYLVLLNQLTDSPKLDFQEKGIYFYRQSMHSGHTMLAFDEDKLVGAISWFLEPKASHGMKDVLHIEDLVVDEDFRGKGLGKALVLEVIKNVGDEWVYKVILNCKEELRSFYEKCGFRQSGIQMRLDLGEKT